MNKFLCAILGHVFKTNIDITQKNVCSRCAYKLQLEQGKVAVPDYGCK